MFNISPRTLIVAVLALAACAACSTDTAQTNNATKSANAGKPVTAGFTAADIAKLKWIEGTWRGMDGDKPFFERYRFEDTTMIVETLSGEDLAKLEHTARFELKDGEFGHTEGKRRSAATEITDDHVQFVPVTGGGNAFRFEHQPDGTWRAVMEWVGPDKAPVQKFYKMEPYKQ